MDACPLARLVALEEWKWSFVEIMNHWRYRIQWQKADEQVIRYQVRCRIFDDM